MEERLLTKINLLKKAIDTDLRVQKLNYINKLVNLDETLIILAYKRDCKETIYEDAIKHFGENSKEVEIAQKELYFAKKAVDEFPLSVQYNRAYKEVRLMYKQINDLLFKDFSSHSCGEKR
jgi:hypothetical protein